MAELRLSEDEERGIILKLHPAIEKIVSDAVERQVKKVLEQKFELNERMSWKEAATALKIDRTTLWRRVRTGIYPSTLMNRDGGRPFFIRSEIEKIKVEPKP